MIKSETRIRELQETLNNSNSMVITEAIEMLREEKPFEGAISLLTTFYDKTDNFSIKKAISGFLNDLKDQSACKEVIDEIRKKWKSDTISMLISSCWQSGLNYADYSVDLVNVFLQGDYVTAIECLTVIEETAHELNSATKGQIMKMLETGMISQFTEKRELTSELISILER